jgi:hypothetical protein
MTETDLNALLRREGALWREARDGCPHPDLLLARGSELVEEATRRRLDAHVDACHACARLLAGFAELRLAEPDAAMEQRVFTRVMSPGLSGWRWLPVAAAVVLVVGAAALWWKTASPTPTARSASTSTSATVERPSGGGTAAPSVLWGIGVAPVRLPLASFDASRGQGGSQVPPGLIDALAPYQSGDYATAIRQLTRVVEAHPDSRDASFYLGVASLLANRPSEALAPLGFAAQQGVGERRDEVEWYLATAEQRTGQPEAARARLTPLCRATGAFQARACGALQALR